MKKTKILPILLCSCGAISVSSYLLTSCDSGAIAHTDYGKIKGTKHNSIYSFKGVPYADSPTNNLRFAPPHNPKPWHKTKDCRNWGYACVQDDQGVGWNIIPQGEDCLNLNIWTPTLNSHRRLPVYVYIHGGVFSIGSSSQEVFDGEHMAYNFGKKDMIVVTFNYRLHALGFMALNSLATQALNSDDQPLYWADASHNEVSNNHGTAITNFPIMTNGNWGLLDQIKALQWIHKNIGYFGGDNTNVTVAGESAGSFSASSLIVSPATDPNVQTDGKPLFQHAVMESGNDVGMDAINSTTRARLDNPAYDSTDPASRPGSIQLCQDMIYEYAQVSDSPMGVRVLRHDFSPERYAEWTKIHWLPNDLPTLHAYNLYPSYDGWALPLDTQDWQLSLTNALKNGKFRNVDTLFGWNTGEGYGFVPNTMPNLPLDHNDLMLSIQDIVQSRLIDINGHPIDWSSYKTEFNLDSHTIDEIDTETYRDIRDFIKYSAFASSTKEFVDQMKINEARSELNLIPKNHYMYNFDYFYWYPSHNYENEFSDGATHTAELPFIFGTDLEEATQEDLLMSKFMMTYWTNFAKNGNVNNDLVPTLWTPMEGKDSDEELTMWFRGGQDFHGNHYPNGYVNSCQMDNIDNKNHVKFIETFYQSKFN